MNIYCSTDAVVVRQRRQFRLCIPFLLVWVLVLPVILLLAPLVFVACLVAEVNPFRGVSVYWQVFNSLRGLRVEVSDPGVSDPNSIGGTNERESQTHPGYVGRGQDQRR